MTVVPQRYRRTDVRTYRQRYRNNTARCTTWIARWKHGQQHRRWFWRHRLSRTVVRRWWYRCCRYERASVYGRKDGRRAQQDAADRRGHPDDRRRRCRRPLTRRIRPTDSRSSAATDVYCSPTNRTPRTCHTEICSRTAPIRKQSSYSRETFCKPHRSGDANHAIA